MASQVPEKGRVDFGVILKSLPRGGFIWAPWSKVVVVEGIICFDTFKAYLLDYI